MPTVTDAPTTLWAHCPEARCPGSNQEQVDGVVTTTAWTYRENGGDMAFVERSSEQLNFADDEDADCKHCGRRRELSTSQRITYENLSGHDPNGLIGAPGFNPARQQEVRAQPVTDEERERYEAQIAKQDETLRSLADRLAALEKGGEEK